ncbi:MAG TPA: hypothetical protein VK184_13900 [Nostocaceae cyanobacterium]|nr:hypothetical protein [Nostocaceae cyanobacterium]
MRDVQHSDSVSMAIASQQKLEVNRDVYHCIEAKMCARLPIAILANVEFTG